MFPLSAETKKGLFYFVRGDEEREIKKALNFFLIFNARKFLGTGVVAMIR